MVLRMGCCPSDSPIPCLPGHKTTVRHPQLATVSLPGDSLASAKYPKDVFHQVVE